MQAINDRIAHLIYHLEMNPNSFAETVGVSGTVIYNIVKGRRSKPSFEVLQKILLVYQSVNANWLLRGEGKVLNSVVKEPLMLDEEVLTLESRIRAIIDELAQQAENVISVEELRELIDVLLQENTLQKEKIGKLYAKQGQIMEVLRDKLSLNIR